MVPQNRIWSGDAQPGLHLIKEGTPTAQPLCHAGGGKFQSSVSQPGEGAGPKPVFLTSPAPASPTL